MRKNNKKSFKVITITAAIAIFGIGAAFAVKEAGSANSANETTVSVVAAGNEVDNVVVEETKSAVVANDAEKVETTVSTTEATQAAKETEATTEATKETEATTEAIKETEATTEATKETEAATEAVTETEVATEAVVETEAAPVIDATVAEVIALINKERADVGLSAVTYDSTLTSMAQTRATENAVNDWFVVENGKHIRPDGRKASTVAVDFGQYGNFGEVMGRRQTTPAEIVAGWHGSATHYACMTNSVYTRVGVGVAAANNGELYWVAIFMN